MGTALTAGGESGAGESTSGGGLATWLARACGDCRGSVDARCSAESRLGFADSLCGWLDKSVADLAPGCVRRGSLLPGRAVWSDALRRSGETSSRVMTVDCPAVTVYDVGGRASRCVVPVGCDIDGLAVAPCVEAPVDRRRCCRSVSSIRKLLTLCARSDEAGEAAESRSLSRLRSSRRG